MSSAISCPISRHTDRLLRYNLGEPIVRFLSKFTI
jgi:hypothetical protein